MPTPSPAPAEPPASQGKLLCILGLGFGWAVTVGGTISVGVFRTPREVATHLPDVGLYFTAWVLGGLYALLGAVCVAELSAAFPRSGGPFVLTRRVLGPYPGFFVGWSDWLNWSGTCAFTALVLGEYTARLFPPLAGREKLLGLAVLLGVVLLQWRGLREGSRFQELTSLVKALAFLALVVCCFLLGDRPAPAPETPAPPSGLALAGALVLAMQGVMYTYSGWEITTYFGEEVQDPGRTIPWSMIGSTVTVMVIYLLLNAALLAVLPVSDIAGEDLAVVPAAQRVFGARGATVLAVLAVVSALAGLSAAVLLTPRILYALGREGLFLSQATRVNAGGTPDVALLLSALASVFFLLTGTVDQLLAVLAAITVANYAMLFLAVLVGRVLLPQAERPYRAWGYPWTPAAGLLSSLLFLGVGAFADTRNSLYALALWVASLPLFLLVRWLKRGPGGPALPLVSPPTSGESD